jgi:hypothetical protein
MSKRRGSAPGPGGKRPYRERRSLSVCQDAPKNKFFAWSGLMGVATLKKRPDLNGILSTHGPPD